MTGPDESERSRTPPGGRPSRLLVVRGNREFLVRPGETLETDLGVLELPADVTPGETVETHLGEAFEVRQLRGPELFDHLERTGAPMMPRDVGLVIGHTGVAAGDRALDAGTGTGILAISLGRLGLEVTTYEREADYADVARENVTLAGVDDRVEVQTGDLLEALDAGEVDGGFDLLTLDTGDAPAIVERALEVLAPGGFVAIYTPFVESARACAEAAREVGLSSVTTFETIQREMDFDERGSRPSTAGVGHTGYLTFARFTPQLE